MANWLIQYQAGTKSSGTTPDNPVAFLSNSSFDRASQRECHRSKSAQLSNNSWLKKADKDKWGGKWVQRWKKGRPRAMWRRIICGEMIKRSSHKRLLLGKKKELCERKELDEFLRSIEFNSGVVVFLGEEEDFRD
ncbi:hypothetical protein V6N13_077449 [Hibiscus sabdariffa]